MRAGAVKLSVETAARAAAQAAVKSLSTPQTVRWCLEHGLGFQCVELVAEGAAGQRTAREGESKGEKDKGETDGAGHGEPPFGVGV